MENHNIASNSNGKPNIVLNLGGVLIEDERFEMPEYHQWYSQYTLIYRGIDNSSYICPAYIVEFMKYAVARFNVHFFSCGDALQCKRVVEWLWQSIFHCNKPDTVFVLSNDDKTRVNFKNPQSSRVRGSKNHYLKFVGNTKKDVTKIGPIENTILVSNDLSYALDGQVNNHLYVPSESYCDMYKDITTFSDDELREIFKDPNYTSTYLNFYKLLHVVGVLETAMLHKDGVINGLFDIFFVDGEATHFAVCRSTKYIKKGHAILSEYKNSDSSPKLERLEKLVLA